MRTTGKRGGINWEIGIYTYTLLIPCQKWMTNENVLCTTENSYLMHCSDQNVKEVQRVRGHMYIYG